VIKVPTSEARKDLSKVIKGTRTGERFLLVRHDKGVAAIVSVEDLAFLQAVENRRDLKAARAALEDVEQNGTVSWDQIKADMGL
jgi:prevent-host-death family protein